MNRRWLLSALLVTLLGAAARADDKEDKAARAELYARLAAGPPGVSKTEMEKGKAGRIHSVLVVGRSRISTVLGLEKGIMDAQDKAIIDAKGRYLQWLNESATVHQGNNTETVIITEGSDEALKEYGKSVDKTTKEYKSTAQGMVSGLQVVYYDQDGKGKTYTVVMKWTDRSGGAAKDKAEKPADPKPAKRPAIPSKKGIIPD